MNLEENNLLTAIQNSDFPLLNEIFHNQANLEKINFNSAIDDHQPKKTLLSLLLKNPFIDILLKNPSLFANNHFKNACLSEVDATVYSLVRHSDGQKILKAYPELLIKSKLNTSPQKGEDHGKTILWWLVSTLDGRELLRQILTYHPALLDGAKLNAAPKCGLGKDKSILWILAATKIGRQILKDHPDLLQQVKDDWAPKGGTEKGKTFFWCLAATPEGREILVKNPALLRLANLDAAPTAKGEEHKTTLWLLIAYDETRKLIKENLTFLQRGNLNQISYDDNIKTIYQMISEDEEFKSLFIKNPKFFGDISLPILKKYYAPNSAPITQMVVLIEKAFKLAEKCWYEELFNLLKNATFDGFLFKNKNGDTLLHIICKNLASCEAHQVQSLLTREAFYSLLKILDNNTEMKNKEGYFPSDYLNDNQVILLYFLEKKHELDMSIREIFFTHFELLRDFLSGRKMPEEKSPFMSNHLEMKKRFFTLFDFFLKLYDKNLLNRRSSAKIIQLKSETNIITKSRTYCLTLIHHSLNEKEAEILENILKNAELIFTHYTMSQYPERNYDGYQEQNLFAQNNNNKRCVAAEEEPRLLKRRVADNGN